MLVFGNRIGKVVIAACLAISVPIIWPVAADIIRTSDPVDISQRQKFVLSAVSRGEIRKVVTGIGTIKPKASVLVGSQLSGQISEIRVSFNASVTAGDVLAVLDDETFKSRVDQAEAELSASRSALRSKKAALKRSEQVVAHAKLSKSRQVSLMKTSAGRIAAMEDATRDFDVAKSDLEIAAGELDHAESLVKLREATLRQARIDLDRTLIRAPIDGVVLARMVEVGQTVAASLQAPELFRIANNLQKIQIEAQISESEIAEIKQSNPVAFTVDAYPNTRFSGVVSEVRLSPTIEQNVVTYTVVIDANNDDRKLYPGMTASLEIETERRNDVLRIPLEALSFDPLSNERRPVMPTDSDDVAIWQASQSGSPAKKKIKIGTVDRSFAEIASGDIAENEQIFVAHRNDAFQ